MRKRKHDSLRLQKTEGSSRHETSSFNHQREREPNKLRGIEPKELDSVRCIGQGMSGIVYETKYEEKRRARKDFPGVDKNLFEAEVDTLPVNDLTHSNIGECVGKSVGCSCCSLVLEYVPDNLHNVVQRRKFAGELPFELPEAMSLMFQIANAIKHLHEQGVAHGDLKPNNVLMSHPAMGQMGTVKLVDYGLFEIKKSIRLASKRTSYLETFRWKAPELFQELINPLPKDLDDPFLEYDTDLEADSEDSPVSTQRSETKGAQQKIKFMKYTDIYSFGMVCYEILTMDVPFSNTNSLNELKEMVFKGIHEGQDSDMRKMLTLPEECPAKLKTLIETCWNKEPNNRPPSFAYICDELEKVKSELPGIIADHSSSKSIELIEPNPPNSKAVDEDIKMPKRVAQDGRIPIVCSCGREREALQGTLDNFQEDSRFDDGSPSNSFSLEPSLEPCLEPKHKIFLSHSEAQKDFTWQLCEDLERVHHFPFFDKRDSLSKGELDVLLHAMRHVQLVVLVLSDDFFTSSKWPMLELVEFVKAQESTNTHLRILPLFLGITRKQLQEKRRLELWEQRWNDMAREDARINVKEWVDALSKVCLMNGMEYNVAEGHVRFRKKVVQAVYNLVPPDVEWDVSHVQSMEQISQPILQKIEDIIPSCEYGVGVVGLYGVGGVGKTTLSKVIYNNMRQKFYGKACYIEFSSMNGIELQKKVLQRLTDIDPLILSNINEGELAYLLKERLRQQKVFLILDNVREIEEALMYLKGGYHIDSIVLVISRSLNILQQLHIHECDCLEMPQLDEKGAIELFLDSMGRFCEVSPRDNDVSKKIIKIYVQKCCFLKPKRPRPSSELEYHYHPLALKSLGSQLGAYTLDASIWEESFQNLVVANISTQRWHHHVFSILREGYDELSKQDQLIFLDLALIFSPAVGFYQIHWMDQNFAQPDVWKWLSIIYNKTQHEIKESVNTLWRKGLLEVVGEDDELEISMHELYVKFAEAEAQTGPYKKRRFLIDKEGTGVSLSGSCWSSLERLIIHNCKVRSLKGAKLYLCPKVQVLQLSYCEELEELDVTGMNSLSYIMVIGCENLEVIEGIGKLSNLIWQRVFVPKFINGPISLAALQVLQMKGFELSSVGSFPLEYLRGLRNLQECGPSKHGTDSDYSTSLDLPWLMQKQLDFSNCTELIGSSPLTNLQDLNLNSCQMVNDLTGLCDLVLLENLDIGRTETSELPELRKLERLQFLNVSSCHNLTSLDSISSAINLRYVDASRCRSLSVLPHNLSSVKTLEVIDLAWDDLICMLPNDYEQLAERNILKLEACWGLVVPLVNELQGQVPARGLHSKSGGSIGCVSMQAWIAARKNVNSAAYSLLKHIFQSNYATARTYWMMGSLGDIL